MRELKVQPIRNGTVIDHIPGGMALRVLGILGIPKEGSTSSVSALISVPSKKTGLKDIVKVEDRELGPAEVCKIALIAPRATINIVRNYGVIRKYAVTLPEIVEGIVSCGNPNCVSHNEPVSSRFRVISKDPPRLRCHYCERELVGADIPAHLL